MEEGALSDRDVLRVGLALCDALAHAHGRGVVHRDVKPGNVMVPDRPHDGAGVAKLTDFGVARIAGEDVLTRTGDVVGTLAYMAPEQAEGREAGAEADLYALALVLYEALAGVNPLRGRGAAATARRGGGRRARLGRRWPAAAWPRPRGWSGRGCRRSAACAATSRSTCARRSTAPSSRFPSSAGPSPTCVTRSRPRCRTPPRRRARLRAPRSRGWARRLSRGAAPRRASGCSRARRPAPSPPLRWRGSGPPHPSLCRPPGSPPRSSSPALRAPDGSRSRRRSSPG